MRSSRKSPTPSPASPAPNHNGNRTGRTNGPDPRLVDTPHTLVAVPDTRGDLLHRLASVEPIGDLYSIILRQLSAANQNVDQSPAP
ncbi:hypothetical protein CAURIC_00480 [Corynebacterium auriscanis]|nr:hypothetical protein CAURIC_00480 [Corynebacterium auriscanis]